MARKTELIYEEVGVYSIAAYPDADSYTHLLKLEDEAIEAQVDDANIIEYADCLICLFAAAFKAGFGHDELMRAVEIKLEINKTRQWLKKSDGTYQHIPK